ncbi:hypothetical protein [Roseovarius sp. THAF8]|uniref:hypothetical protein n=1 Tax=Roseovarius sp. THAF8 TaxID=2587846 RepID=UPI00126956F8
MLNRVTAKVDLTPQRLIADTAYGTGPMLGWLVDLKTSAGAEATFVAGHSEIAWEKALAAAFEANPATRSAERACDCESAFASAWSRLIDHHIGFHATKSSAESLTRGASVQLDNAI